MIQRSSAVTVSDSLATRKFPIGVEVLADGCSFRVWAPSSTTVEVVSADTHQRFALQQESNGYFSATLSAFSAGDLYWFTLDGSEKLLPDPASRFQPNGPEGPSQIIDPNGYHWRDFEWQGLELEGQILYELHVGTFTSEGTWTAAIDRLPHLAELSVTAIEVMPVADFAGTFGWGYDGVNLFAPTRLYGTPDDFRAFVDSAHQLGIGVILDVVYNHFGPSGNYLPTFSDHYLSKEYQNEWGDPVNYDGAHAAAVREFVCTNAEYWVSEFHIDGLRLDAVQQIFDSSDTHIVAALTAAARKAAGPRSIIVTAEHEAQDAQFIRASGGHGLDAMWNDDFHHSCRVALCGHSDAYFSDYRGTAQEIVAAALYGFLYQGQYYSWQKQSRGSPALDIPQSRFIAYLENHDQVANHVSGTRLHRLTSPGRWRAISSLLLLGPWTPLLFQGQEWGSANPFLYFADHAAPLATAVEDGRRNFLSQFRSAQLPEVQQLIPTPHRRETFQQCKLDWASCSDSPVFSLYRDLIALRRSDSVLADLGHARVLAAALSEQALLIRYLHPAAGDRLLIVNYGPDLSLNIQPMPLLAPRAGNTWELVFSSESVRYGGHGPLPPLFEPVLRLPGETTLLLSEQGRKE